MKIQYNTIGISPYYTKKIHIVKYVRYTVKIRHKISTGLAIGVFPSK